MSPPDTLPRDEWEKHVVQTLRKFVLWWESDAPDRHLGFHEAHELANAVMSAKGLIDEYDERKETSEPPGTPKDA